MASTDFAEDFAEDAGSVSDDDIELDPEEEEVANVLTFTVHLVMLQGICSDVAVQSTQARTACHRKCGEQSFAVKAIILLG